MSRRFLPGIVAVAVVCVVAWWRLASPGPPPASVASSGVSLLAVGDTGKPREWVAAFDAAGAVAAALADSDRDSPVDGLVLLGDNFYPDGLREREFKDRVRANLVQPFCHFIRLTSRGLGSLAESCPPEESDSHPVPIHALLGNHDYNERESPLLQRRRIPQYVANWKMPTEAFEVRELSGGVSLILLDSMSWLRGDGSKALVRAVRKSRGPWRIVAAHHPMVDTGKSAVPPFEKRMREILEQADVPIHVFVSGHEHNLQVIEHPRRWPRLHVIAGSGSDVREPTSGDPGRRFALGSHGFARLDVGQDPAQLTVTLFEVATTPGIAGSAQPVASFAVDPGGSVSELPLARR